MDFNAKSTYKPKKIDDPIFRDGEDYWQVADNIRNIYMSDGSLTTLLDFERVLDELDVYAFKNWEIGELVSGPVITKYRVSCIFMWPETLMPDPRGARRLLPFDCTVKYKRTNMKVPIKVTKPDDYRNGTHKAKISEQKIWLVELTMPKSLMSDIRTGSIEMEDQDIDLDDLDQAYEKDVDKQEYQQSPQQNQQQNDQFSASPAQPPTAI
jgi:hypothetical protein